MKLSFSPVTGNYEITYNGFEWSNDGRKPYIILRKKVGGKYISTYRPLQSALHKEVEKTEDKIICRYSNYIAFGRKMPFTLICTAKITGDDMVEFSLKTENETGFDIQAVYFPAPFNAKKKCKNSYAVDPMRQGFIMPDGYKKTLCRRLHLLTIFAKSTRATHICRFGAESAAVTAFLQSLKLRLTPQCSPHSADTAHSSIPFIGSLLLESSPMSEKSALLSTMNAIITQLLKTIVHI